MCRVISMFLLQPFIAIFNLRNFYYFPVSYMYMYTIMCNYEYCTCTLQSLSLYQSIIITVHVIVVGPKMDAVQLLLHTFTGGATFLNPQATRCSCLYSLEFDSSGFLTAASVRVSGHGSKGVWHWWCLYSFFIDFRQTFLLEKMRVAFHPEGELSFNILYQLIAGADSGLR